MTVAQTGTAVRLPPETRGILFAAVRELLTNVVKHAGVGRARVTAAWGRTRLRLEVTDAGRGFPRAALRTRLLQGDCFGLFNLQERLRSLGGRCEIRSAPGRGTRVRMTVPYDKEKTDDPGKTAPDHPRR